MKIGMGVDTLSYHCRLEAGEVTHEQIIAEAAEIGYSFVQLNAYHLRAMADGGLAELKSAAAAHGLQLTLSGDVVGRASKGDTVEEGARRIAEWIAIAEKIGSPFARVSSGFYRNELLRHPGGIAAEQKYVADALALAASQNTGPCRILLENHSDFAPDEYAQILQSVDSDRVGVFLDLINPVSMLLDPLPVIERLFPFAGAGHVKDFRLVSSYVEDGFHRRGFDVQYCYPGEGVADLESLVGVIARADRDGTYLLSVEGLDNRAGVADQRERLSAALGRLTVIVASASKVAAA